MSTPNVDDVKDVDWQYLAELLWIYKWLIFILLAGFTSLGYFFYRSVPSYKATGTLMVNSKSNSLVSAFAEQMSGLRSIGKSSDAENFVIYLNASPFFARLSRALLADSSFAEKFPTIYKDFQAKNRKSLEAQGLPVPEQLPAEEWLKFYLKSSFTIDDEKERIVIMATSSVKEFSVFLTNVALKEAMLEIAQKEAVEIAQVRNFLQAQIETNRERLVQIAQDLIKLNAGNSGHDQIDADSLQEGLVELNRILEDNVIKMQTNKNLLIRLRQNDAEADISAFSLSQSYQQQNDVLDSQNKAIADFLDKLARSSGDVLKRQQEKTELEKRMELEFAIYVELYQKLINTEIQNISSDSKVTLLDEATMQSVAPKLKLNFVLVLSSGLSMCVALLLIFSMESFSPKIRAKDELPRFGIRYLGNLPEFTKKMSPLLFRKTKDEISYLYKDFEPSSIEGRAFQQLRVAFINYCNTKEHPPKVIAVTSCLPASGKTFTASNLSSSLAEAGKKILVIDTDYHVEGLTRALGKIGAPGLSDFLSGAKPVGSCISQVHERLDFLSTGSAPKTIKDLGVNHTFRLLLKEVMSLYDAIVIDTAPVLSVTDAHGPLNLADVIVLVAKYRNTKHAHVLDFLQIMSLGHHASIVGIINRTKGPKFDDVRRYRYGYGYGYYNHPKERDQRIKAV